MKQSRRTALLLSTALAVSPLGLALAPAANASGSVSAVTRTDATDTLTTLESSANPSSTGEPVTYTATVSPVPDGGTVAFNDGASTITGCDAQPVDTTTGEATCEVTDYNEAGSHTITAAYGGDDAFNASAESAALTQEVDGATLNPTTTSLAPSSTFVFAGQPVTLTATVTGSTFNGDPGQVYFFDQDGNPVTGPGCPSSQPINAAHQVVCTIVWQTTGTKQVQALYTDGWGPDAGSTSPLQSVTVAANNATLSFHAAHATVTYGSSDVLSGVLSTGHEAANGRAVTLSYLSGSTWKTAATTTSGTGGSFGFTVRPAHNTTYRAAYAGGSGVLGNVSAALTAKVASKVTIRPSTTRVRKGAALVFSGTVTPNQHGQVVSLQRLSGGAWHTVLTGRLSASSSYRLTVRTRVAYYWRVSRAADTTNAAGVSARVHVAVH